jgi:hypothetical protein
MWVGSQGHAPTGTWVTQFIMQHSAGREADSYSASEEIFLQNGNQSLVRVWTGALYLSLS